MITMLVLAALGGLLRAQFKNIEDGDMTAEARPEPWLARWPGKG
ncbi:MAG: hypothetical protein AAGI51_18760 [Pseudomonadota bacterium]